MGSVRLGFMEYSALAGCRDGECFLDDGEKRVFEGLKTDGARGGFLAGRILAKRLVGDWAGVPPGAVRISVDEGGKPGVDLKRPEDLGDLGDLGGSGGRGDGNDSVFISITHSEGWAACACSSAAVGLDMERRLPARDWRAVAEAWFHPEEREYLMGISDAREGSRRFHRLWTVKEAYIKAHGLRVWDMGNVPRIRSRAEGEGGLPDALCFEPIPDLFCSLYSPAGVDYRQCRALEGFHPPREGDWPGEELMMAG